MTSLHTQMLDLEEDLVHVFKGMQKQHDSLTTAQYDVVVVGAGPYGLSTAAHLLGQGLTIAVFGKPLGLWRDHMPEGMLLRSYWWATNLSDPLKKYGFTHYFQERDQAAPDPVARETFLDYGLWFQQHVDQTYVATIEQQEQLFTLTLTDDRLVQSKTVVMAPGLNYFASRPVAYDQLSAELVSHTSNHASCTRFAGKRLVVIGGGQSALETAALAHEAGADVAVVSRSPIVWLRGESLLVAE